MKLSKETLMKIIQEELGLVEQDDASTTSNPMELEKEIELVVESYLGQNNDESYELIERFVKSLMELKKSQKTRMEEANIEAMRTKAIFDSAVAAMTAGEIEDELKRQADERAAVPKYQGQDDNAPRPQQSRRNKRRGR